MMGFCGTHNDLAILAAFQSVNDELWGDFWHADDVRNAKHLSGICGSVGGIPAR